MYHKTTTVALAVLLIALVSLSDASNYWRVTNKGRLGNARYTARSPRIYDTLKNAQVKRYAGIDDVEAAEGTVDNWLRDWIVNNRNFLRNTLFEDSFTNEV